MSELEKIMASRRDTRHFLSDEVPDEVIQKALKAGHLAPSVGLTDATKYFLIHSQDIKKEIKKLFLDFDQKAQNKTDSEEQKQLYQSLKLEAIEDSPLGLVICYDRLVLNNFTIGTIGSNESIKMSAICAAQNIWLSLTEQGFSMGWISILNYHQFKKLLGLPENLEPIGYFCVGKPATNYSNQPMLQQLGWKQKSEFPSVEVLDKVHQSELINEFKNDANKPDFNLSDAIQNKIDNKTKPKGSLGVLESLAKQIAMVFNTLNPKIIKPNLVVFAADHGIANHSISAFSQDVTRQMVTNFLDGNAAINVFCNQNQIELSIVDAGVNYDFPTNTKLINNKIDKGTQSFLNNAAMSISQLNVCFEKGREVVQKIAKSGSNCIGFGEMGIGNTATAAVLMAVLCDYSIENCVGKGTGIDTEKLNFKIEILAKSIANYSGSNDLDTKLAHFGGFEIMQMAGGMLEAHKNNMLILVDGFISSVAFLIAFLKNSAIKQNAIFCHCSAEKAHKKLLDFLEVKPILNLDLRLGEGTGCAIAFPIIESAVAFFNEMASFETAVVNK